MYIKENRSVPICYLQFIFFKSSNNLMLLYFSKCVRLLCLCDSWFQKVLVQFGVTSLPLPPGVSNGAILVFDVPSKGSNITLSEVLEEHKEPITDMASECSGSQVRWGWSAGVAFILLSATCNNTWVGYAAAHQCFVKGCCPFPSSRSV